jgi:alkanesulfonate monooxygenase SsuD/methylene tetrahydromethanopterin reductase-like flavin-dependent oxidoreductase (luciferase family)
MKERKSSCSRNRGRDKIFGRAIGMNVGKNPTGSSDLSFPTLEEASKYVYTAQEEARQYNKDRFVIGSAANVAERLKRIAKEALVDEIMIADFYPDQASRLKGETSVIGRKI